MSLESDPYQVIGRKQILRFSVTGELGLCMGTLGVYVVRRHQSSSQNWWVPLKVTFMLSKQDFNISILTTSIVFFFFFFTPQGGCKHIQEKTHVSEKGVVYIEKEVAYLGFK